MNKGEEHICLQKTCRDRFQPVVDAVEQLLLNSSKERLLVAIDGKCGSGKTTLAYYLMKMFNANLLHMDDFFLQSYQRTEKRLNEVGGNVDYERFCKEVLLPIQNGKQISYRVFDCHSRLFLPTNEIQPKRLNIIEGSYSEHPYFGEIYDLKIFMEISIEEQRTSILKRNGKQMLSLFQTVWIPKENQYFETFQIKEKSQIIINW